MRRRWGRRVQTRVPVLAGTVVLAVLGALGAGWSVRQAVVLRGLRAAGSRAAGEADAKRTLLRLASHEMRTPLALARGYVDIVRSETLGPIGVEVEKALGSVEQQLQHIEQLIIQMVDTARMDGPGMRLVRLDVREIVEEAAERVEEQLGPNHELHVSVTERPAMVMGERFRLRTVLVNLLGNAIKYSPQGGEVRCTLGECRHGGIQVVVADRGIGLGPAETTALFEPFKRLPNGVEAAPSGLGLGLHLARTITEAHRGTLTAAPNPGGGAVFTLWLPSTD